MLGRQHSHYTTQTMTTKKPDLNAPPQPCPRQLNRRHLLVGSGAAVAGMLAWRAARGLCQTKQPVFVARNQQYHGPIARTIRDGLIAVGFDPQWVCGRTVLLKPNLVEPTRQAPHLTTHPAMVVAAAEVFRSWGANLLVGEAPGHVRDTEMALIESGFDEALHGERLEFVDLNYSESVRVPNAGKVSDLPEFHFPKAVAGADLIVSMPKLKTHVLTLLTGAIKNTFGAIPGFRKATYHKEAPNPRHFAHIIVDIFYSLLKASGSDYTFEQLSESLAGKPGAKARRRRQVRRENGGFCMNPA